MIERDELYDITLPMSNSQAGWPGDTPFDFCLTWKMREGSSVNVGGVTMSTHTGTHTDAPFHFQEAGATVDQISLNPYLGPAVVLDVSNRNVIRVDDLRTVDLSRAPRLLLRTNAWTDHTRFPDRIPVLARDVPAYLTAHGVCLLGLDVPSVDELDSKELPIHHALASGGIHILESLDLTGVPEGEYELIALPLKIVGGDGAPVRAVLRRRNKLVERSAP